MRVWSWLRPEVNRRVLAIAWIVSWVVVCVLLWLTWKDLNPILKWSLVAVELFFCPDTKMITFAIGRPGGSDSRRSM